MYRVEHPTTRSGYGIPKFSRTCEIIVLSGLFRVSDVYIPFSMLEFCLRKSRLMHWVPDYPSRILFYLTPRDLRAVVMERMRAYAPYINEYEDRSAQ